MADTPQKPLAGEAAVVTGASSGLGKACAQALAARGANVVVNYNSDEEGAADTVARCEEAGAEAIAFQANVADEGDVKSLFAAGVERFGSVDILIANAGLQRDGAFTDLTLEEWNTVISVNLTGVFLSMQEAVRQFRRQGMRQSSALGKIVVMSSVHDTIPWAGHVNYAAAKGGVSMLMKSAAQELSSEKIRINACAPGAIATSINASVTEDPQEREKLLTLIPYGRVGEPSDIGRAVAWLCTDEADYMVGSTMVIDGGMELYPGFRDNG